jgi:hypothetical protein
MPSIRTMVRVALSALFVMVLSMTARASEWQRGDVFVAIGNGQIQVYRLINNGDSSSYNLIETLTDGSGTVSGENGSGGKGFTAGCAFDSTSHLYTTNFSNANVYKFKIPDPHKVVQNIHASAGALSSESMVFDGQGNLFVGHADGTHVVDKFDPTGAFLQSFTVAVENRGSDWTELSPDGNTLYYTSEGVTIKTFNLSTNTQGPDFFNEGEGGPLYTVRILPPSFGSFSGNFLVSNTSNILRLVTGDGVFVAQTYTVPGAVALFALGLDTNGTSFWAGDLGTGNLYRIDVASGLIEFGPIFTGAVPNANNTASLGGICVNGVAGAAQPQPVVQTITLTPNNNTGTVANDNSSNTLTTTLNGLTQTANVTIAFTEIPQQSGNSGIPGYGPCELQSADGTKCVVHQISIDTLAYNSIDFYHHWNFKPTTPINPRMIKNGTTDITTAVYLDPGTKGHTLTPSTYVDNEAPSTTGASCGFIFPPNNITWEAEFPLPFVFDAVATGNACNQGPFLTSLHPIISLGLLGTNGTVTAIKLPSTAFHVFEGVWYYTLGTKSLQPGTYIVSVFDKSNSIPAFSEQIVIVPED